MSARLLGVLVLGLVVVGVSPAGDAAKKDLDALQGAWVLTLMEEKGKKAGDDVLEEMAVEVKGDRLTVTEKGKVVIEFTMKLDPSKKPKAVDFTYLSGEDKGHTELGIYELQGDTVKFCVNEKGKERPKTFTTAADNEQSLVVMKRKK